MIPFGTRTTKGWEADVNFTPAKDWEVILAYSKVDPRLETGNYALKITFHTFPLRFAMNSAAVRSRGCRRCGNTTSGARVR